MSVAIKVENLSKAYQLGEIGTGTISRDIERWVAKVRGKDDPFLKIGEANDRTSKGTSDIVWSLKDVNFEIEQGDAVGIIGNNGAGKSTLLKILSRVTSPTTGKITGKGRIASLLEVGTGFHPELTGKENIYLNGAILGMRKTEIKRKFDEIVEFAGVERYIETPVKRYSSGMYVRLAFAVAAHLESEILIVDEVLAVGDAEFQKKCLGKMGEVSKGEGRTVLFVSHNMASIASLCSNSIFLKKGSVKMFGSTTQVIDNYQNADLNIPSKKAYLNENEAPGDEIVRLLEVMAIDDKGKSNSIFDITQPIGIKFVYSVLQKNSVLWHGINVFNENNVNIFDSHSVTSKWYASPHPKGRFEITCWVPGNFFNEGKIVVNVAIFNHSKHVVHLHEQAVISFEICDFLKSNVVSARGQSTGKFSGVIRPLLKWE